MTVTEKNLPNKPLVEAILEIKWQLGDQLPSDTGMDKVNQGDPAFPLFVGPLASGALAKFPVIERLPASGLPDDVGPHIVRFRFRAAPDRWPVVQVGPGVATLNSVDDYTWDSYRELAIHLWDNLNAAYAPYNEKKPPKITNLGLRYINAAERGDLDPLSFVSQRLHTAVTMPVPLDDDRVLGPTNSCIVVAAYPLAIKNTTGTVRIQSAKRDDRDVIVWEQVADAVFADGIDRSTYVGWLDEVHSLLADWFRALTSGDLYEQFRVPK